MKKLILVLVLLVGCSKEDPQIPCTTVENNGVNYQIQIPDHNFGQPSKQAFIESFSEMSIEGALQFAQDSSCY